MLVSRHLTGCIRTSSNVVADWLPLHSKNGVEPNGSTAQFQQALFLFDGDFSGLNDRKNGIALFEIHSLH
jgi:hypothetical protein